MADDGDADIAQLPNGARGADAEAYRADFAKLARTAQALGEAEPPSGAL